ncbi:ADP-ribosylglycohydrolase family protein [Pseudoduganella umbonata]|nr:ADP-ribosylglycohydrolase family protein [Pseudoduganella umbonata]
MRESNWQYALDSSAGFGNFYAADRGEAYLSYWEKGLGISSDGSEVAAWRAQANLNSRPASCVVAELTTWALLTHAQSEAVQQSAKAEEPSPKTGRRGKRQQRGTVRGRFLGCLLGGAVGDALGAPVEFMKRTEILQRFGPDGITQYAPAYGGLGKITDDTQMTLFTAEGLIRGWVRGCLKGTTTYAGVTAHAYLRWLLTQGERPACDISFGVDEPGWLIQQRELYSRRAPGNTCLSALRSMQRLGDAAHNNSKGCGGVMRVAPAGLFAWRLGQQETPEEAFNLGTELAALTHGHPTGALTGGVLAVLILALTDGVSLPEAIDASKAILRQKSGHEETLWCIELAERLAVSGERHEAAIAQIGQGWIAEEALGISIYCALVARNFRHGVVLAVNHDGDSDSTGAIVGNLLGTMHGLKAIPSEWLESLELRDVITALAEDLYAFKDWKIDKYSENLELKQKIWKKYPGC